MNSGVRLALAIPQTFLHGPVDTRRIRDFLARAETLGFESVWVSEQVLGSIPSLDPVELLTYAAAVTERIRLGFAVLLTALRSPVHLAKTLATLDHLSRGRLIIGVGLGVNTRAYPAFGISADRRVARFVEGLRLMQRLWIEPRVTFQGRFWTLENASMEPKPVQKPHPPIWFGAHHPKALTRAVAMGDGFIGAGSSSTTQFVEEVGRLRSLLDEARRDPATFAVGKRVYIAVDKDKAKVGKRLAEWFGAFYGRPELAERVSVYGEPQECVDRLAELVAGGARFLILNPVFDETQQLERFASEIAPKLSTRP
ncbi:MAG: LLM class flavin-dependent oxidoreductase [Candidatus Methylomirabilia bacterium]